MKNTLKYQSTMKSEKIPPQAVDAEISVLGICLLYPDRVHELSLKPEMFYSDKHRKIFASILEVSKIGLCDIVTVTDDLRKKNELDQAGGPVYITKLISNVFTDQLLSTHALLIQQAFKLREYIRISSQINEIAYQEDLSDVVEFAETAIFELSDYSQTKEPRRIDKCVDDAISEIEQIYTHQKELIGAPSGFTDIDRITGGWQAGNLVIIAGRPSMGKTAFALQLASNAANLDYPVGLFSLEMSEYELTSRLLSGATGYSNVELRNAKIDFQKLVKGSKNVSRLPIIIDDTPDLSLSQLRSKVKKMILRYGIKLVIVDYLQLMTAKADTREREVSTISRGLKSISKEYNIPVIALSQLNRGLEDRADKKPRLSDLRESGAIEQDADIVCFVYRPAYYGLEEIKIGNTTISSKDLMILDSAKNRSGALFTVALHHNESMTTIYQ